MELIELVSSHVTMPVIGVVLCALMVFTFGFRSPAQPPSFTFEENLNQEKRNKKRSKQAKIKSSTNGNVKITDSSAEAPSKATSESPKVRPVLPSKPKPEIRKEATQDAKGEKKLKVKRESGKGGVKTQNLQAPTLKKETEEEGEWTTIQMSKKSKKPKPSKKESLQQAVPVVEAQHKSNTTPEVEVAAIAPGIADVPQVIAAASPDVTAVSPDITAVSQAVFPAVIAEVPTSPESDRIKHKKKKEKVAEKNKSEDQANAVTSKPIPVEPHSKEHGTSKKKNKGDRKTAGEASTSPSEIILSNELLATEPKEVELTLTPIDAPGLLEQTKPVQKNKKNAGKEIVQKEACQSAADMQIRPSEKPEEAADESVTSVPSKATNLGDVESEVSPGEQQQPSPISTSQPSPVSTSQPSPVSTSQPSPVSTSQPPVGICFDEIGDAWVNAAPKSKKKKPRRDN